MNGQGRDPNMFGDPLSQNGWRYGLGLQWRTYIGNGTWVIKWLRARWRQIWQSDRINFCIKILWISDKVQDGGLTEICTLWTFFSSLPVILCPIADADAANTFATSSRWLPTDSVDNLETVQTDSKALDYTDLLDIDNFFNNDVIMSSLLKKLSTSIKIHVVKQLWSLFGQFANCRPNPSAVVVSVGGVYWA